MSYKVILSSQAEKTLKSVEKPTARRLAERIDRLSVDPTSDAKVLENSDQLWSARVGGYRILYDIDFEIRIVAIEAIESRGQVYRRVARIKKKRKKRGRK